MSASTSISGAACAACAAAAAAACAAAACAAAAAAAWRFGLTLRTAQCVTIGRWFYHHTRHFNIRLDVILTRAFGLRKQRRIEAAVRGEESVWRWDLQAARAIVVVGRKVLRLVPFLGRQPAGRTEVLWYQTLTTKSRLAEGFAGGHGSQPNSATMKGGAHKQQQEEEATGTEQNGKKGKETKSH